MRWGPGLLFCTLGLSLSATVGCGNDEEVEALRKEVEALREEVDALKADKFDDDRHKDDDDRPDKEGYCLRLEGGFTTIDGDSVDLDGLEGAPLVLNFWSTYSVPSKIEHDDLVETRRLYEGQGVRFYGVMWNDTLAKAQSWRRQNEPAFPILIDSNDRLAIELGVSGVPETVVLDKEGCVQEKFIGSVSTEILAAELEPLL